MEYLDYISETWNTYAEDPMKHILVKKEKWNERSFFSTGEKTIKEIINELPESFSNKIALDFGCGIGRLSSAISFYFEKVIGVDLSINMIDKAKSYKLDKCEFRLNGCEDLKQFDDKYFDAVFTLLTLQHLEPYLVKKYLYEFFRITKTGGVIIFDMPSCMDIKKYENMKKQYQNNRIINKKAMEMHMLFFDDVLRFLEENNIILLKSIETQSKYWWKSCLYICKKR